MVERLVGRAADLAVVRAFLSDAAARGGALLLSGQPGVGKSALLEAAARTAAESSTTLLRASGVESETDLGFSGLHQLLAPSRHRWLTLDHTHREALAVALGLARGSPPSRPAVTEATLALLRELAVERPVLVIVDDLQWIDRASAGILGVVARRLDGSRAGILAAVRSGPGGFFESAGLTRHEVPPLEDRAAARLVSRQFPMLDARVLRRVVAEAGGNPLALLELPTTLNDAQRAAEQALPSVLPLSDRLQTVFASRVATLPPGARRFLLVGAVEGTGDLHLLRRAGAADTATDDGWDDLTQAQDAQLIRLDRPGGRFTFRHPLVRSAVIAASTAGERQRAHQVLADVLLDHPERRAWHLADATVGPNEAVARILEEAAHRAQNRGDPTGALTALLRSADLSPDRGDRSRRLSDAAYLGTGLSGDLRTASELLAEVRLAAPARELSLHAAVAASLLLLNGDGDIDTATRLLAGSIDGRGDRLDSTDPELLDAMHYLFELCLYGSRPDLWDLFRALLNRLDPAVPAVLNLLVSTMADPVRTAAQALPALDAAISDLQRQADPLHIGRISVAALTVDRTEGCRDAVWRVIRAARDDRPPASALPVLMHLSLDDFFTGRWEEAAELAEEGFGISSRLGYRSAVWPFRITQAALAAVSGDHEAAVRITDEVIGWAAPRGANSLLLLGHYVRGLDALGRGDFEAAYQHATAISPAGEIPAYARTAAWVVLDLIEAAVRTGRHAEAAAHVTAVEQAGVAQLSPRAALLATAGAAVAGVDAAAGDLFGRAVAVPGADRWPFELARVHLMYGEHLRRARATTEARHHLSTAHRTFERLGARPWVARAETELRAAGAGRRPASTADDGPVVTLTPQEREVVLLAAAGLTNRQIAQRLLISRRTVDVHLYRSFAKLGISTRAALPDAIQPPGARAGTGAD
jgi:DNA-binding CsgD family transcriptional regulator